MEKKRKLNKRSERGLILANIICFIAFGFDSSNTLVFLLTHIITLAIFMFNSYLLFNYSKLFMED